MDEDIDHMKEALLNKEGIVAEEGKEDFRYFVGNCMNRVILDQIGGDMNSFRKKSFRLN